MKSSYFKLAWYLIFIWLEFGGIYHAFSHSAIGGYFSVIIPPYAWYRSIEFFWHEEEQVDWEKKASTSISNSIYLLSMSINPEANQYTVNNDLYDLSERIKKFPEDQKNKVKDASALYVALQLSLVKDMISSMERADNFTGISLSNNSEDIISILTNEFNLKEDAERLRYGLINMSEALSKEIPISERGKDKMINKMRLYTQDLKIKLEVTYKKLFNEKLKDNNRFQNMYYPVLNEV